MRGCALTTALLGTLFAAMPALANEDVLKQTSNPKQWAIQTGDYANQRYSKLDQINRDNVKNLRVAWTFSTGVLRGHEGGPLVIGNMMYVHTPFPNTVFALDLSQDGKIVWKYEPRQNPDVIPVMCCDTVNRGVAYANDTIFLHQADTTVVALDAQTGEVKWTAVNGDPTKGETNTATVLPVKDKVIVGISGGEFGVRGRLTALDAKSGEIKWRWYTLPGPGEIGSETWPKGTDHSMRGGATIWNTPALDPELGLLYFAVGNCGLKSLGMDHGNPSMNGAMVLFCSDEHITFVPETPAKVGDLVRVWPAHIDPTIAYHEQMHVVSGDDVVETWDVDLRGW